MARCGNGMTMYLCVLTVAAVATGKPHGRCASHDDYATAYATSYYNLPEAAATSRAAFQPPSYPLEYGVPDAPPCRSGRSYSHGGPSDGEPTAAAAATAADVVSAPSQPPAPLAHHSLGHSVKLTTATLGPCKGPSLPANETAAASTSAATLTVDKLTAYYDRLKAQQELLARRQLEVQMLEQQQRRQHEYALVQQQIQQQYYQQQQHAMLMLDQLHKNPAFISQMAAYMEQRLRANNGTAARTVPAAVAAPVPVPVPSAPVEAAPAAEPDTAVKAQGRSHADDDSDQDIIRNGDDNDDEKVDPDSPRCGVPTKREELKRIANRDDKARRIGARNAQFDLIDDRQRSEDDSFDFANDRQRFEDDPIVEKIYKEISE